MQKAIEIFDEQLNKAAGLNKRPNLLLHVCCAPCLTSVIGLLKDIFEVTLFFCNPNIFPEEEYLRRRDEIFSFLDASGQEFKFIESAYLRNKFKAAVSGYENEPERGLRCALCVDLRLRETSRYANAHKYDYFATTLTVSPHKDAAMINKAGLKYSGAAEYLVSDFKKRDGYLSSLKLSKQYGLYRQNYCGCTPADKGIESEKHSG